MERRRVVVIGLDGLELTLAERLMADGRMPALAALRDRSAWFRLDHGPAQRTGLAWEHVASGRSPDTGRRWAAVEFDPATYEAWQEGARFTPWWADADRRVVVFDPPYVDLAKAPNTRGIVGWGAHDPGTVTDGQPGELVREFERRVGPYPAPEWTYGLPWPSAARTEAMGTALREALHLRTAAARWLASEAAPDWDLLYVVEGELHGAVEGMWHGVDPTHPLHGHLSSAPAERAILDLYVGLDELVAEVVDAAPDAAIVAFAMGGMGPNHSDVASMVLLPELLYRHAFGRPLLQLPPEWTVDPRAVPLLGADETWSDAIRARFPSANPSQRPGVVRSLIRRAARPVRQALGGSRPSVGAQGPGTRPADHPRGRLAGGKTPPRSLGWQPAYRYRRHWPQMPAFAIPSFYDGRIRLNLLGRERDGIVQAERYGETVDQLEQLLRECRNPRTGEPAVASFERPATSDPLRLSRSEADLLVIWNGVVAALEHPALGLVGPVPLRRTGGHTGPHGVAFVATDALAPGDRGVRSAFDVVPTIASLLGVAMPEGTSGTSLL